VGVGWDGGFKIWVATVKVPKLWQAYLCNSEDNGVNFGELGR
jgi:hypothetical protein